MLVEVPEYVLLQAHSQFIDLNSSVTVNTRDDGVVSVRLCEDDVVPVQLHAPLVGAIVGFSVDSVFLPEAYSPLQRHLAELLELSYLVSSHRVLGTTNTIRLCPSVLALRIHYTRFHPLNRLEQPQSCCWQVRQHDYLYRA